MFIDESLDKVKAFMRAVKKATDFVLADPTRAWEEYVDCKPSLTRI